MNFFTKLFYREETIQEQTKQPVKHYSVPDDKCLMYPNEKCEIQHCGFAGFPGNCAHPSQRDNKEKK